MSDTVAVADYRVSLERIINDRAKGKDMIVTLETPTRVDTDVIFVRNCRITKQFFTDMLSDSTYCRYFCEGRGEKWAFEEICKFYGGTVSFVCNRHAFCSRIAEISDELRYVSGDFAANCSGAEEKHVCDVLDGITEKMRDYIRGNKKVAFTSLKKESVRESRGDADIMKLQKQMLVSPQKMRAEAVEKFMNQPLITRPVTAEGNDVSANVKELERRTAAEKQSSNIYEKKKLSWGFEYPQ